jgi:hypothetical protein
MGRSYIFYPSFIHTSVACAAGRSVNRTLTRELNCKNGISNLKLISSENFYSKFNISLTLGLKMMKSPPRNPTHSKKDFQ